MKSEKNTPAFLLKRKRLLVLPILTLPFVTLAFWALGGGKTQTGLQSSASEGLNMYLPEARVSKEGLQDKMSFYEKAKTDSFKWQQWEQQDPYYQRDSTGSPGEIRDHKIEEVLEQSAKKYQLPASMEGLKSSPYSISQQGDAAGKVMKKLAQLNEAIHNSQNAAHENGSTSNPSNGVPDHLDKDEDRLQQIMQGISENPAPDPEMQQISAVMDKILDIQHPERVKQQLQLPLLTQKGAVFPVTAKPTSCSVSLFGNNSDTIVQDNKSATGFYGWEKDDVSIVTTTNTIEAVMQETKTVTDGATVKLRIAQDVIINGIVIPKENFIYGVATINGERLQIHIPSIRYKTSLFPVKLSVYDLDGLEGIYIPNTLSREVMKQSSDNTMQAIGLSSLNPSLAAQATDAGLNALKSLLGKKVKQIKVTLTAGYKVFLKEQDNE